MGHDIVITISYKYHSTQFRERDKIITCNEIYFQIRFIYIIYMIVIIYWTRAHKYVHLSPIEQVKIGLKGQLVRNQKCMAIVTLSFSSHLGSNTSTSTIQLELVVED